MKTLPRLLLFSLFSILITGTSLSNERRFSYTYETSVLPPGARELELWNTERAGRSFFYRRLEQRAEFEFGVANNLMSAFYLNTTWSLKDSNEGLGGGSKEYSSSVSISNEWKYKISDRVADPLGFALYGEGSVGLDEYELEGKLLFDKEVNDFLFALNVVGEQEWEYEIDNGDVLLETEFKTEIDFGISYRLKNNFSIGAEAVQKNVSVDGTLRHSAFFAGPVAAYTSESWWTTLTVLPQIKSFTNATTLNKQLDLDEFEKIQIRLLFSFHL